MRIKRIFQFIIGFMIAAMVSNAAPLSAAVITQIDVWWPTTDHSIAADEPVANPIIATLVSSPTTHTGNPPKNPK